MPKRTLDSFFASSSKRPRTQDVQEDVDVVVPCLQDLEKPSLTDSDDLTGQSHSHHVSYPHPIADLPPSMAREMSSLPARQGKQINNQPDLDLLYFEPYIPSYMSKQLFTFLRANLPFYRVEYDINRGAIQTHIKTPRWTTVFGVDDTSYFDEHGTVKDKASPGRSPKTRYAPRPIPACLDVLRKSTEAATGCVFNFCLVNYYASGADSISFHSDDERFLGRDPAIASFSLGAKRDFLMKHKPVAGEQGPAKKPLKLPLDSGDMVLMRGPTQSNWLHSIPKRTGKNQEDGGRINITFRRAMVKAGTDNYYNYNVGSGPVYRWDERKRQMELRKDK